MQDRETPIIIYAVPQQDDIYRLKTNEDLEVSTRGTGAQLAAALSRPLRLNQSYALYVRVPDNFPLNRLGLDSIDKIVLIPVELETGALVWPK